MFDSGHTGYMLLASCLVLLMTPGLAFFYGGLVGRKNILAIMMQSFVSMGVTTVVWFVIGYSLCFSGTAADHSDFGGVIGNLDMMFLHGVTAQTPLGANPQIPLLVFFTYQMMTAIITPALITGAFANRIKFKSYLIFLVLWLLLVYCPAAHMVWGKGALADWGVKDFAGGIVVHTIAGMAALASVFFVGKRRISDSPHSIPLAALGAGMLWFGWFGFNSGNVLGVDGLTVQSFLVTHIGGAFGATAWLFMSWIFEKKPKFLGFLTGAVAGLVVVTPGAGYITVTSAAIIGLAGGVICYLAIMFKNRRKWDDALDVWGVHGVGGILGMILLGVFASELANPLSNDGANGLLRGNSVFFVKETVAVLGAAAYAFLCTYVMLFLINKITPVTATEQDEEDGLDTAEHGEQAYEKEAA